MTKLMMYLTVMTMVVACGKPEDKTSSILDTANPMVVTLSGKIAPKLKIDDLILTMKTWVTLPPCGKVNPGDGLDRASNFFLPSTASKAVKPKLNNGIFSFNSKRQWQPAGFCHWGPQNTALLNIGSTDNGINSNQVMITFDQSANADASIDCQLLHFTDGNGLKRIDCEGDGLVHPNGKLNINFTGTKVISN